MRRLFSIRAIRPPAECFAHSRALPLLCGVIVALAAGCAREHRETTPVSPHATSLAEAAPVPAHEAAEPDLAVLMGEFQRHSMKLGYSIEEENQQLAAFYAHEVGEVLASVEQIETHDGVPIAAPTRGTLTPALEALETALSAGDWNQAADRYRSLISACNDCHQATQHGFVVITEPPQPPPFNQSFAAKSATP